MSNIIVSRIFFDWEYYLNKYQDIAKDYNDKRGAFYHFYNIYDVNYNNSVNEGLGLKEGRLFNKNLEKLVNNDIDNYINNHDELKNKRKFDVYVHYLVCNNNNNNNIIKSRELFDWRYYLHKYSDIINDYNDEYSALYHFYISGCGIKENRLFNDKLEFFDYNFYIKYYTDSKDYNYLDACVHFLQCGIKENRLFNDKLEFFDYNFYIKYYTDLKDYNYLDACVHFLQCGINEDRFMNENLDIFNYDINNLSNSDNLSNFDNLSNYKFIHITKTGGTSIEEFGYKLKIKWGKYDKVFYNFLKKHSFWHIPLFYFDKETLKKYKWFTIIRNPYDRIISEINFLIKAKFIKEDININLYLNNILTSIVDKNNNLNKDVIENNDKYYSFHFIPMFYYTCYDDYTKILDNIKIIRFENLNKEINYFFNDIGIKEKFNIHQNKTEKIYRFEDLSLKNIKLINKIYKKDFLLFNYKFINLQM